jgi:hypothetical protein
MKYSKILFLSLMAALTISLQSCHKDDGHHHDHSEEEVITTLIYKLTAPDGSVAQLIFRDTDGDGGNAPVITTDVLKANTMYTGAITLSNESENPAEDITEEVAEEKEEHQFFLSATVSGLTISYADTDVDCKPVGLATTLSTGAAGSGNLQIVLRHEPDKFASGVASGDITNAGGETDIEVDFAIVVE